MLMAVLTVGILSCSTAAKTSGEAGVVMEGKPQLSPEQARLYDHFFMEAMIQRQKGQNDAAFDLLNHCLDINPHAAEVYFFMAQYYSALKQTDKSLDFFQTAARLNPQNETYMETLAQVYIRQQNYQDAITVVEKLYERHKDRENLLEMLFQLYQEVGDFQNAVAVLDRIEMIDGKSERLSLAKSEVYTRMGNEKAAVAEMAALAKQYPNDLNYLAMYGESLMMNGETKQALDIYNRILTEEPNNNRVLMSLRTYYQSQENHKMADSLTRRVLLGRNTSLEEKTYLIRQIIGTNEQAGGDSTEVLRMFHQMMAVDTTDVDIPMLCATYMDLKKMPSDSIKPVLNHILKLAPDNSVARLHLVGYAWAEDDKDRVIELCQTAREYNPDDMAFYYYQGIAYYQRDSLDQALSTFQNGVSVINERSNADIVSDFYEVMGEILHKKGRVEEAFAAYDSCLQWKPDNIPCLNNYAYYLSLRNENLSKAETMSMKTLKAEPKNATYLDTYAWILFMQKRYSEAKIYIDQTLQCDSDSSAVLLEHAGDIYYHVGEREKAVSLWQQALAKATEKSEIRDNRRDVLIRKIKLKRYLKE